MHRIILRVACGIGLGLGLAAGPASALGLSGAYLAAMQADFRSDYANSERYLDRALRLDSGNPLLLQNAVVARVAQGDIDAARPLADTLAEAQPDNQIAGILRLADLMAAGEWDAAETALDSSSLAQVNALLAGLIAGWIEVGRGDFDAAQAHFDAMTDNAALAAYGQYHKALALALAGDFVAAEAILAGDDDGPLHLNRGALVAHAQILAQIDRVPEAIALIDAALASGLPDAALLALRERLAAGETVAFERVRSAADGAAGAFEILAEALAAQGSERLALIHARLALHLRPDLVEARLLAAGLLEAEAQFALATAALDAVPEASPWYVTARIRRAGTQTAAGDAEAGIDTLRALAERHPDRIEVHSGLGNALRAEERFDAAVAAYDAAVALVETPTPLHWVLYYTRGIANERAGNWDAAEADFRQALALQPDQPLVLNYLGYSLVEEGRDLDEALGMIERAVAGQPDDGYITDSLGWVLYRLGRFDEALPHMLRAAELAPVDPVVNDHLGDVLWMVGREREAVFQWRRALSFGPEEEGEAERIRRKLDLGLDAVLAEETEAEAESDAEPTDG